MRGFEPRDAAVVAELDDEERTVLARIVADVGLLLAGERFGLDATDDAEPVDVERALFAPLQGLEEALAEPDDPAILRLLPNAAPDDREVADEFRRLTEADLRGLKVDRLRRMWRQLSEDGEQWRVERVEADATAAALTDVRLVLATRLGLSTDLEVDALHAEIDLAVRTLDEDEDAQGVDHERVWLGMLYEALTWLQESLVRCLMDAGDASGDAGSSDTGEDDV